MDFQEPGYGEFVRHGFSAEEYVLLFLNPSHLHAGHFVLTDPAEAKFLLPADPVEYQTSEPLSLLEEEFLASYDHGDHEQKKEALLELGLFGGSRTIQHLLGANPADEVIRGWRYSTLLLLGDATEVQGARTYIETPSSTLGVPNAQGQVAAALGQLRNADALPHLEQTLIESPSTAARLAAAEAVRAQRNPSAEACLIKALDDPDREVRYQAVMGLADTERNYRPGWGPGFDEFQQEEAPTIALWKAWWLERGGPACPYGQREEASSAGEGATQRPR